MNRWHPCHRQIFGLLLLLLGFSCLAGAEEKSPWAHESELGIVNTSGNTSTESYNGKQQTSYTFDQNALKATGHYLQTKTAGIETAKSWDAALRYERLLSTDWSVFLQHGAESNPYAGFNQRDNTDLGGKYIMVKNDNQNLFTEAGYRYTKTLPSVGTGVAYTSFGRLYLEYSQKLNETMSGKLWIEYLPNLQDPSAYLLNDEISVTAMLSKIFSMKSAYTVRYQNRPPVRAEYQDTIFTTALVAKF
jgi:putative salt-induced outer membrane protein